MTRSKSILNIFTAVSVGLLIACTIASFVIRSVTQPKVETVQPTQYSFALGEEWVDVLAVPRKAVLSETRSFFDEDGAEHTREQYYVYVAVSSLGLFGEVNTAERIDVNLFPLGEYAPEDYHPEYGLSIRAGEERIMLEGEEAAAYGWSPFAVGAEEVLVSGGVSLRHRIITTELDRVEDGTRVRIRLVSSAICRLLKPV